MPVIESKMNKEVFLSDITSQGFCIVDEVLDEDFILRIKSELEKAIEEEARFHGSSIYREYGMLLACPVYGGAFLDLLENSKFIEPFN